MNGTFIETPRIGDILKEEFLDPLGLTAYRLSKELNVSTSSILDLIHGRRKISVEMALRLSKFFGNSHRFWTNLQTEIDIRETRIKMEKEIEKIHRFSLPV